MASAPPSIAITKERTLELEGEELEGRVSKSEGLDPRCRIVVVSASLLAGRAFVDSVIALSGDTATTGTATATAATPRDTAPTTPTTVSRNNDEVKSEPLVIPHTLTNRYYTAPVHFAVYTCAGLARVLSVSSSLQSADARVEEEGDEQGDIPLFKSEVGNGGLDVGFKKDFEGERFGDAEDDKGTGNERIRAPGVVYVWADGEGCDYKKEIGGVVRGMRRAGWEAEVCLAVRMGSGEGDEEEEDVDGGIMELGFEYVDARDGKDEDEDGDVGRLPRVVDALSTVMWVSMQSKGKGKGKRSQEEEDEEREGIMRELMDVVVSQAEEEEVVMSPVEMEKDMLTPFGRVGALGRKVSMGFEDEFMPGEYRTLRSVSDFGGSDGYVELDEEEWEDGVEEVDADWGEPTQQEIEETAGKIFGGFRKASEGVDLSEVLESLQAFKGEIAEMEDSGERKKMAARVALGLAYGLDIE